MCFCLDLVITEHPQRVILDLLVKLQLHSEFTRLTNVTNDNETNNQLNTINEWLLSDKLSLNIEKTRYMVFHTNQRRVLYPKLYLNMMEMERVTQFNFLCIVSMSNLK